MPSHKRGIKTIYNQLLNSPTRASIENAYPTSLVLTFASLFSLGFYLGRVARENGWFYGLKMLVVGVAAAVFIFLILNML